MPENSKAVSLGSVAEVAADVVAVVADVVAVGAVVVIFGFSGDSELFVVLTLTLSELDCDCTCRFELWQEQAEQSKIGKINTDKTFLFICDCPLDHRRYRSDLIRV